jgi:hypothetical protein
VSGWGQFRGPQRPDDWVATDAPLGLGRFSCPSGQLVLASVCCADVAPTWLAGDTASVPRTLSKTLVPD